jgi:hypothetical protein
VIGEYATKTESDPFELIEDEDEQKFSALWSNKSVMTESQGKVKVLIVDYGKMCMDREEVLTSLKNWFGVATQEDLPEESNDELPAAADAITPIADNFKEKKGKLEQIHNDFVDCMIYIK